MNEIICPNCGHSIELSMTDYNKILQQVRDAAFDKEVDRRVAEVKNFLERQHALESDKLLSEKEAEFRKCLAERASAYQASIRSRDEEKQKLLAELDYYKNLKITSSTKMVGESLEQYCSDEFDKLRATAFAHDYFEKDNKLSETGSKGDFIYRAYDENGEELVSIMFEMKNEMQSTAQKHKNSDFFKELDKDRKEKGCEYAVLVSLLEAESDLYNQGIVDVSHRYEKMFVIRPQFFIVMISLLRNAAMGQTELKQQIARYKQADVDLIEMEHSISEFKDAFSKNYDLAQRKFDETVASIDKAIAVLQKAKDSLVSCERNMHLAGDKTEKLSVKLVTKNSPSIRERLEG